MKIGPDLKSRLITFAIWLIGATIMFLLALEPWGHGYAGLSRHAQICFFWVICVPNIMAFTLMVINVYLGYRLQKIGVENG